MIALAPPLAPSPLRFDVQPQWFKQAVNLAHLAMLVAMVLLLWMVLSPAGRRWWRAVLERHRISTAARRMARGAKRG